MLIQEDKSCSKSASCSVYKLFSCHAPCSKNCSLCDQLEEYLETLDPGVDFDFTCSRSNDSPLAHCRDVCTYLMLKKKNECLHIRTLRSYWINQNELTIKVVRSPVPDHTKTLEGKHIFIRTGLKKRGVPVDEKTTIGEILERESIEHLYYYPQLDGRKELQAEISDFTLIELHTNTKDCILNLVSVNTILDTCPNLHISLALEAVCRAAKGRANPQTFAEYFDNESDQLQHIKWDFRDKEGYKHTIMTLIQFLNEKAPRERRGGGYLDASIASLYVQEMLCEALDVLYRLLVQTHREADIASSFLHLLHFAINNRPNNLRPSLSTVKNSDASMNSPVMASYYADAVRIFAEKDQIMGIFLAILSAHTNGTASLTKLRDRIQLYSGWSLQQRCPKSKVSRWKDLIYNAKRKKLIMIDKINKKDRVIVVANKKFVKACRQVFENDTFLSYYERLLATPVDPSLTISLSFCKQDTTAYIINILKRINIPCLEAVAKLGEDGFTILRGDQPLVVGQVIYSISEELSETPLQTWPTMVKGCTYMQVLHGRRELSSSKSNYCADTIKAVINGMARLAKEGHSASVVSVDCDVGLVQLLAVLFKTLSTTTSTHCTGSQDNLVTLKHASAIDISELINTLCMDSGRPSISDKSGKTVVMLYENSQRILGHGSQLAWVATSLQFIFCLATLAVQGVSAFSLNSQIDKDLADLEIEKINMMAGHPAVVDIHDISTDTEKETQTRMISIPTFMDNITLKGHTVQDGNQESIGSYVTSPKYNEYIPPIFLPERKEGHASKLGKNSLSMDKKGSKEDNPIDIDDTPPRETIVDQPDLPTLILPTSLHPLQPQTPMKYFRPGTYAPTLKTQPFHNKEQNSSISSNGACKRQSPLSQIIETPAFTMEEILLSPSDKDLPQPVDPKRPLVVESIHDDILVSDLEDSKMMVAAYLSAKRKKIRTTSPSPCKPGCQCGKTATCTVLLD